MIHILVVALLAVGVAATWLACLGLWRLPTAMDRLHLVAFVTLAAGLPLLAAAVLSEGAAARVVKIVAILVINLLAGAAGSHAMGRAFRRRGDA